MYAVNSINPGVADDATCDGVDDDCDGSTDEEYSATATGCGIGACSGNAGLLECQSGALVDSCDPYAGAAADDSLCDGQDNDCDGLTDEEYASVATSCGVGACAAIGTTSCAGGTVVDSCIAGTPPTSKEKGQACSDGIDNDCDGLTDSADSDCSGGGGGGKEKTETKCSDGRDNDRDGLIDCADSDCAGVGVCP